MIACVAVMKEESCSNKRGDNKAWGLRQLDKGYLLSASMPANLAHNLPRPAHVTCLDSEGRKKRAHSCITHIMSE